MKSLFLKRCILALCCIWAIAITAQFKVPEKPKVIYPVYDEVSLLTAREKDLINQKLIAFNDSTSVEILVVILPSTLGEDPNFAASQIGNEWQIGKKGKDNGVVLLIASEDRTISIQQGRDVERHLTASDAGQIIDYLITPYFKKREYYKGIDTGVNALMQAVQGKYKPNTEEKNDSSGMWFFLIIFFIIVLISIFSKTNGDDDDFTLSRGGKRRYRGGYFPPMGGFGGSGSGGFGGFGGFGGGGSFGGGGASGSW